MGRIRVLSDVVANKIAAGEVVERPASVVKELLENSLDARATRVRLDVEAGGRRLIRIADDGHGMMRDDALLAFERHATSKLSDVKQLFSIETLGFRGEALPSIASVSRLLLETRSDDEPTGTAVEFAGGKLLRCEEMALATGTTITVRDLFYNVPVRRKFLRSEQTELAHIASLVTHYSLAYPEKSFELRHNGNELLAVTPVARIAERVFQVFGSQTAEELMEIPERVHETPGEDGAGAGAFRLHGFASRPQVQKFNRNSIYLFVNGRLIRDRVLLHALSAAYRNLIPPDAYPFALLFLECPAEAVDVNVHPSKTEVRFRHSSFVHDFVRDTVRERLVEARPVSSLPVAPPAQAAAGLPYSEFTQQMENRDYRAAAAPWGPPAPSPSGAGENLPHFTLRGTTVFTPPKLDFSGAPMAFGGAPGPAMAPPPSPPRGTSRVPDTHGALPPELVGEQGASLEALRDLRPLGQLHDSFILAVGADGLWIIDQHVAHERILFERVLRQMAAGTVEKQQLLMPIVLELSAGQQVEYSRVADDLQAVGFEIEPFGPRAIAVNASPADLSAAEVERVIFEILEIADKEMRRTSVEEIRADMAASIACRAAIKINTPLDLPKMRWMLSELAATEFPMSCPHGRPIALRYGTREILKGFHRI
ncbi:MAG: DNA mismatch repair endonuclease MutL [Bryobacteraceae bacterium]